MLLEVENLVHTGKTQNKLLEQVFTEYSILQEVGLVIDRSESEILKHTLENKDKYAQERKSDNAKADELHNMQYLLVLIDDALKNSHKDQPKLLKKIKRKDDVRTIQFENILKSKNVRSYIENENLLRELSGEILARFYSFIMGHDQSARYIPILNRLSDWKSSTEQDKNPANNKLQVINAVFKSLPMPSIATPLEEILEFKKDSEAKGHILALNNWIIDSATKNLSSIEIEQKIEYLIHEYDKFISLNKLKFEASRFEIAVTSIAEIAENLVRLKFSKVAKTAFQLFKNDIRLLEAEMNAPGREVAYISSARNKFQV